MYNLTSSCRYALCVKILYPRSRSVGLVIIESLVENNGKELSLFTFPKRKIHGGCKHHSLISGNMFRQGMRGDRPEI